MGSESLELTNGSGDIRHFSLIAGDETTHSLSRIVADDNLLRMDSKLSTDESALLHIAISRNSSDTIGGRLVPIPREVRIDAAYYANLLKIDPNSAYMRLRNAAETLFDRELHHPSTETRKAVRFRWITSIGGFDEKPVNYSSGTISFRLSEELCSYLENLEIRPGLKTYTTIMHRSIQYLKPRSTAILKYLLSHVDHRRMKDSTEHACISIDEIRRITHTENLFQTFGNLNNKVIKPAVEDIILHSDYDLDTTMKKQGRKVIAIIFSIGLSDQTRLF